MRTWLLIIVLLMAVSGIAVLCGKCIGYNRDEPDDEGGQSVECK